MSHPPATLSGNSAFTYPCGATYVGEFSDGKLHGRGKLVWPDGAVYEGEFCSGLRQGCGVSTSANGTVHEGRFWKGVEDGKGSVLYAVDGCCGHYSWHAGDRYHGGWRAGKRHGAAKYTFFNGDTLQCQWSDDVCAEFHRRQADILAAPGMQSAEGRAEARAAAAAKVRRARLLSFYLHLIQQQVTENSGDGRDGRSYCATM